MDPGREVPAPAKTQKMNLFYLEEKEEDCASSHCNKHVPKMVLLLCWPQTLFALARRSDALTFPSHRSLSSGGGDGPAAVQREPREIDFLTNVIIGLAEY